MTEPAIALIACSNGFGHVRRMLALALALECRGARPVLFAPAAAVERMAGSMGISAPEVVHFDTKAWLDGTAAQRRRALSSLSRFDVVVSDNLIEILDVRPDAWLSGSFFWHRALDGVPAQQAALSDALLATARPRMISTALFAADYLADQTQLHTVGLYAFPGQDRPGDAPQPADALVACGRGGGIERAARELVETIATGAAPPFDTVWVEPSLYRGGMPDWMRPADFSPSMYGRIKAAVIRPGIGTVTDALLAGARVFTFFENGNSEMQDNSSRIASAGLGECCRDGLPAWKRAVEFAEDSTAWREHNEALSNLDRHGAEQAASLIMQG